MHGMPTDKLASRKDGPFTVAEVLSPHRVRLELPAGMGINDEFDVSQLDVLPSSPDPFAAHRPDAVEERTGRTLMSRRRGKMRLRGTSWCRERHRAAHDARRSR